MTWCSEKQSSEININPPITFARCDEINELRTLPIDIASKTINIIINNPKKVHEFCESYKLFQHQIHLS